jgi:lipopolysaccharide heptosyltransferase III
VVLRQRNPFGMALGRRKPSLRQVFQERPPSKILVVRTDRVGDLILSTPFLSSLREQFPRAEITAWVAPYCQQVLDRTGLVDHVVTSLPSGYFDLAVSLAPRSESLKNTLASAAPVRVGYIYTGRPLVRILALRCLTHCEVVTVDPPDQVEHEVEHLDRLARTLGLPPSTNRPLALGVSYRSKDWTVLHLGDRWFTKGWKLEHLIRLCYGLETFGRLVVTAGPREAELVAQGGFEEFDLRTGLRFEEWCQLIGESRLLISPDTGAVHVAAALGTPVVVAYEEESYEHCSVQWRPWMVDYRALAKGPPEPTLRGLLKAAEELLGC